VRGDLAEKLEPTHTGWFGQRDPFAFDIRTLDYAEGARRFEAGTPPVASASAACAALGYLIEVGVDGIGRYLDELVGWGLDEALGRGLQVRTPTEPGSYGPNIAVVAQDAHAAEEGMREQGFIVSARNDVVRVAPHFYNSPEDLSAALDALARMPQSARHSSWTEAR
jgi:selenocysteine lyase/cysteine desulfurase